MRRLTLFHVVSCILLPLCASAQDDSDSRSADDIAAELANPNAPLASLTTKFQYRTFDGSLPGASDQSSTTLLFQPSFPFKLDNGDSILFRPALPVQLDFPVAGGTGFDSESGIGDLAFDIAYAKTSPTGLLTAKKYVIGVFPNHQWDVGGAGEADINLTTIQLFGTYLPGGGWNVGSSPIISYDHNTEEWTVPLNFSFGRTVIWNGRAWKLSAEINYFVESPDEFGPDWLIGVNVAPVVDNVLAKWFQ
jgi:hypothetical protein